MPVHSGSTSKLLKKVTSMVHQSAVDQGIVTEEQLETYQNLMSTAKKYYNTQLIKKNTLFPTHNSDKYDDTLEECFNELLKKQAGLSPEDKVAMSRLAAIDSVVISPIEHYIKLNDAPSPKEQFEQMLGGHLDGATNKRTAIEKLTAAREKMLISWTLTRHPTIYHTKEAMETEQALYLLLKTHGDELSGNITGQKRINGAEDSLHDLVEETLIAAKKRIDRDDTIGITPVNKISVQQEQEIEELNLSRIRREVRDVFKQWNGAVDAQIEKEADAGLKEEMQKLKVDKETIEKAVGKTIVVLRTWGKSGDADGRPYATSVHLYSGIKDGLEKDGKTYTAASIGLRQNASVHRDFLSALFQRLYFNSLHGGAGVGSEFQESCDDFIDAFSEKDPDGLPGWENPRNSIFQQLTPEARTEFVKRVIKEGHQLIPDTVAKEAIFFNEKYHDLLKDFLEEHKDILKDNNVSENPSFADLRKITPPHEKGVTPENLFQKLQRRVKDEISMELEFDDGKRNVGFLLNEDGSYQLEHGPSHAFLADRFKLVKGDDGEWVRRNLDSEERHVLMDVAKRLSIANWAIEEYGADAINRHQIANFAEASDFYTALLLFKETGLVDIDITGNGPKVTNAKIGIMPLIETLDDMKKAPEMFKELLKDPLVLSYYEKRGIAEFMMGFSDGAKSAGNFASQWEIHQTMRALREVFQEHDIETRFFEGRGRGSDRGGMLDVGNSRNTVPPEVRQTGINDATIQADLPMAMGVYEEYGEQFITNAMIDTMNAQLEAAEGMSKEEQDRREAYEKVFERISELSSECFLETVKGKDGDIPETGQFLDGMPKSGNISSRPGSRGGSKAYDDRRAIGIEYAFNMAGMPAHHVGFKKAIQTLIDEEIELPDAHGNMVKGEEAIKALYHNHEFFKTFVDVSYVAMQHSYDPIKARNYGREIGVPDFVESVLAELEGLDKTFKSIAGEALPIVTPSMKGPQQVLADSILVSAAAEIKGTIPSHNRDPEASETLGNGVFVTSTGVSGRSGVPRGRHEELGQAQGVSM